MHKTSTPHGELQSFRNTIDQIDERIVLLIAKRFEVTKAIGKLKAEHGFNPVDPEREQRQRQRYNRLALENRVCEEVINGVFRLLIDAVVAEHITTAQTQLKAKDA